DISGGNTAAINVVSHASSAIPFALPGCCLVTSSNPPASYLTIQAAINGSNPGATITLCSGTYNEQVVVNKSVHILGATGAPSVVNFTGTVSGKPALFDVSQPDVSIRNITFKVDLTKLSSAIIASALDLDSLTITNNTVEAYGSSNAASFGAYGNRNAISI